MERHLPKALVKAFIYWADEPRGDDDDEEEEGGGW